MYKFIINETNIIVFLLLGEKITFLKYFFSIFLLIYFNTFVSQRFVFEQKINELFLLEKLMSFCMTVSTRKFW